MSELNPKEAERWRDRYYDQLDALERKESEWRRIEVLLRHGLLRLCLVTEPRDAKLQEAIEELRAALRRGTDSASLGPWFDSIDANAPHPRKGGAGDAGSPMSRLLNRLVTDLVYPRALPEAKLMLGRIAAADDGALLRVGGELVTVLNDLFAQHAEPPLHSLLLQLVEYLAIPAELDTEVEAVKSLLAKPLANDQVDGALRRIADLVAEVRRRMVGEKRELESFLRLLTKYLQELDHNLHAAVADQWESFSTGRRLDQAMNAQMEGLEASMQSFNEIEALKTAIQQRVSTIRDHMESFRLVEEQRSARAEQSVAALTERLNELEREAVALRERVRRERSQAMLDPLTGIPNRLAYDERMEQEYQRWKRYRSPLSLLVWDVDRFKRINDLYGHQAGDKVLKVVAKLLSALVRNTDFLCRYGGEEFVLLLPETTLEKALLVAEKLRASVEAAEFHHRDARVKITISSGIAQFGGDDSTDDVFARADKALYEAKAQGRNCCKAL